MSSQGKLSWTWTLLGWKMGIFRKSSAGMGGIHERGIEYLQPLARFQLLNYLPCVVEELLFSWTCANFESFSSKWWTIWVQIVNLPGRSWPRWPSHSQSFGPQDNPSISPWNGASKLSEQRWQMDFFFFWFTSPMVEFTSRLRRHLLDRDGSNRLGTWVERSCTGIKACKNSLEFSCSSKVMTLRRGRKRQIEGTETRFSKFLWW